MDAYEWVLLNCMHDDQLLFVREDGVEQTWSLLTPVIDRLESITKVDEFPNYAAGSSGPNKQHYCSKETAAHGDPCDGGKKKVHDSSAF